MDYKKTTWVPNETPLSAENFNNMEKGIEDAANSINDAERNISKLNLYNENFKTYNLSLLPVLKGTLQLRPVWGMFTKDLQFESKDIMTYECILAEFTNNTRLIITKTTGDNFNIIYEESSGKNIVTLHNDATEDGEGSFTTSEYLIAKYVYPNADNTIFEVIRDEDSFQHSIALYFDLMQNKHNQSIENLQSEHSKFNSLTDATEIQIDDDLNKYTIPGNYAFRLNYATVYIINTPTTERFNLKVYYSVNKNYPKRITQQLTDTNGNIFIRTTSDSGTSWTEWIRLATIRTIHYHNLFNLNYLKNANLINIEIHFMPKQISIHNGTTYIPLEIHGMYVDTEVHPEDSVAAIIHLDSFVDGGHCFDMLELYKDGSLNGVIGPYQINCPPEMDVTAFDAELTILKCVK